MQSVMINSREGGLSIFKEIIKFSVMFVDRRFTGIRDVGVKPSVLFIFCPSFYF